MNIAGPIIRTKLRIPRTRPELVERPDLLRRAVEGLRGALTVIAAPAGFGKTTLAAAAVQRRGLPTAWLSLDGGDNSLGSFLAYLTAALQSASAGVAEAAQLLAASQPVPAEIVLTSLVNDLEQAGGEWVLALDDYHTIHHPEVHAALAFLLEHQPQNLHLLIATRTDPPLPLTRLRARAQVVEIRAAELRFSEAETAQFLNQVMGLKLGMDAVALLEERTEGWIAGLQMAALSLRDRPDRAAFLAGFSGTHRYILDYLIEEVLAGQPPEVQEFLLRTSVLDRLNAALCAVLMAEDVATAGQAQAAAMLDRLDRNHLFLTALDDERLWYRYHPLFVDLLRARREQLFPGLGVRLHQRASAWLEANGYTVEAVNQALAAGDHDRAARLVEQNTSVLLARGELSALMTWITALPMHLRQTRPWLCVHQAYVLLFAGQMREIPALLEAARQIPAGMPAAQAQAILGAAAALEAMAAAMTGRDPESVALARQACELLPPDDAWNRATAAWALGYAQRSLGNLEEARAAFEEQIRLARVLGNIWTLVTGMADLAQVLRSQGHLPEARALFEEALHQAALQGARGLGYIARMEAGLASVLYEQNALDAAAALLSDSEVHCLQWPNPNHLAYTHAIQARLRLALGRRAEARASMDKAVEVIHGMPVSRMVRRMVEAGQVNLALADGSLDVDARAVLERWTQELDASAAWDENAEMAALTQARVWLADRKPALVQPCMLRVIHSAVPAGRRAHAASAFVLCALAAGDDRPAAQAALGQALLLAEPGRHVRLFLDEGPAVQPLLAEFLSHAQPGDLRNYARMLLAAFGGGEHDTPTGGLVEPLSAREREVLALMAEGASNQQIAARLVVAPGTVKAHTASIYRKLDVVNRTAAVARARQLGLIS
jgi:LuxR family maltose regulon positive regulatory protein